MMNYGKQNFKFLIIFLIFIVTIKTESIQKFKAIYLSGNYYFIVNATNIFYYSTEEGKIHDYTFTNEQKLDTESEAEMITYGEFRYDDVANCLIVKHYFYAMYQNEVLCHGELGQLRGYPSEVYPFKCFSNNGQTICFFIVGFENSSKVLNLLLYENTVPSCTSNSVFTVTINLDSDNFNCQLMQSPYNEDVLTCFYQTSNEIKASSYKINIDLDIISKR